MDWIVAPEPSCSKIISLLVLNHFHIKWQDSKVEVASNITAIKHYLGVPPTSVCVYACVCDALTQTNQTCLVYCLHVCACVFVVGLAATVNRVEMTCETSPPDTDGKVLSLKQPVDTSRHNYCISNSQTMCSFVLFLLAEAQGGPSRAGWNSPQSHSLLKREQKNSEYKRKETRVQGKSEPQPKVALRGQKDNYWWCEPFGVFIQKWIQCIVSIIRQIVELKGGRVYVERVLYTFES